MRTLLFLLLTLMLMGCTIPALHKESLLGTAGVQGDLKTVEVGAMRATVTANAGFYGAAVVFDDGSHMHTTRFDVEVMPHRFSKPIPDGNRRLAEIIVRAACLDFDEAQLAQARLVTRAGGYYRFEGVMCRLYGAPALGETVP